MTIGFASCKIAERNFYLSVVPKEFGVNNILYRNEKAVGFGPGANESGIRVYKLPQDVADAIQAQGLDYLKNLSPYNPDKDGSRRGYYSNWLETPIEVTRYWTDYMSLDEDADFSKETPSISNYVCHYSVCIDIVTEIRELANNAIKSTGSYYAYGSGGVLIIIPEEKLIIFAYSG